jgi:hypothetical protein
MAVPTDPVTYARIKEQIKRTAKSRWPSAYLSAELVKKYKAAMEKKGKKPYAPQRASSPLTRWFKEKWIDIKTGKPCGDAKTKTYYPTCRPSKRIAAGTPRTSKELTKTQKEKMIRMKQKAKGKTVTYN